ncbi:MAG TPA: N-acetylglucosamine-6-phosphate deacetylase [Xanthobacteraceae bacterium]|nr:N-acetylglucosamine-6-phosphate deacetylase [Xanthobacteraceae bacterium]
MSQKAEPATRQGPRAILADRVFDGRRWHAHSAVLIQGGRIRGTAARAEVPPEWPRLHLPAGSILAPGFIDLQVNGGGGVLLNDQPTIEGMRAIARAHRRFGTTACLPTLITDTRAKMAAAIGAARSIAGRDGVLGVHLEGPFINSARKGIHRADLIATAGPADLEMLAALPSAGRSLVTLAPECVPAGFIRQLTVSGVCLSIGHSQATAGEVACAVGEGATGVTHLFNAMPPLGSRAPGIIGAALADERLIAGIIVDGLHVDPVAVRAAFAAKGPEGIALVTDAMPTVGAEIDTFDLLGRDITLADGRLTAEDGTLAGAHLDMASAVRNAVNLAGLALEQALQAASLTPARFLNIASERGSLAPGAYADLVALSPALEVIATWAEGDEALYDSEADASA